MDITKQLVRRSAVLIGPVYQLLFSKSEKAAILDMIVVRALLALVRLPSSAICIGQGGPIWPRRDPREKEDHIGFHTKPHPPRFMNSNDSHNGSMKRSLWDRRSMGGRWNMFRNPPGNCFMVRHAVILFQKCVNIVRWIIAKAFPKGDARLSRARSTSMCLKSWWFHV